MSRSWRADRRCATRRAQDTRKFCRIKAVTLNDGDVRLQPDFGIPATTFDVDVTRLARKSLVGEEEVAQTTVAKNDRIIRLQPVISIL